MTDKRNARRTLIGTVASSKGDKTITVVVERTFKHPKYNKYVRKRKKYHAHDEQNAAGVGDQVEIVSTRPLSKLKRWRLGSIVQAAPDRGIEVEQIAAEARADVGIDVPTIEPATTTEANP
jgi:small subunit ribosomal protein S17